MVCPQRPYLPDTLDLSWNAVPFPKADLLHSLVISLRVDCRLAAALAEHTVYVKLDGRVFAGGANGQARAPTPGDPPHGPRSCGPHSWASSTMLTPPWCGCLQGQLGNGSTTDRRVPVWLAAMGYGNAAVSAGAQHTVRL